MQLSVGKIVLAGVVVAVSFGGTLAAMGWLSSGTSGRRPALTDVPPLAPATRTSVIVTPVAIALAAIRDATEQAAPRDLTGKRENPLTQLLSNAEIGWTVARGPLVVTGRPDALVLSSTLNGTFRATGQISSQAGNLTGAIGNLLGGSLGQGMQNLTEKTLDQRADIR